MKSLPLKFDLGDFVIIKELHCDARVLEMNLSHRGLEWRCAYWMNGERHDCWLAESELEPKK